MGGDALVAMEDLDRAPGEADPDRASDQAVRDRVEGALDIDMVVGVDLRGLPLGVFEGRLGQGRQRGALDGLEHLAPAEMAHGPVVEFVQEDPDRRVELPEREEAPVPEAG